MTTEANKTSRRALLGAMAALPALALAAPAIAQAIPSGDDSELLARFDAYCRALKAFEDDGDLDDPACPIMAAWNAATVAMDGAAPPTTVAGSIAVMRYGLGINNSDSEEQAVLMHGTAADRAAWTAEYWPAFDIDFRPFWGAMIALEAMEAAR